MKTGPMTNRTIMNRVLTALIQYPGGVPGSYELPASVTNIGEALIGKAISKRRAEVVLMTKCGHAPLGSASERAGGYATPDWDPAMLARSIDRSLKNLRTDHVDVMQFHSPSLATLKDDRVIEVLHKARERGQARFVGCSADADEAVYAVECGAFDTLQISLNIAD